ncbi:MAG: energy transducer TonB [Nitrospira sp.]|nr:energy transducer TonB [Nitrospira sp.]MDH4368553.1 energy transducer TonB [Nitrospira sp.]MDH5346810.1 energy transducer TonB [Nitrospira sp.]MDH5496986.1 energy transducer TonB [Nitrospira sp.]MDH5724182.1 energy transducer TonB [Nitrospira sp.]
MFHPAVTRLIVVAGLLSVAPYQAPAHANGQAEAHPVPSQTLSSEHQWVTFDFAGSNGSGNLQLGQPLELTMTLGGISPDPMPFVAICESANFESQIVTLKPDPASPVMKATTTLAPVAQAQLSPGRRVFRLHVTFARSTETKFERLMTRIVYLTVDHPEPVGGAHASSTANQDQPSERDLATDQAEPVLDAIPLGNDQLVEEDLLPPRSPQPTPAYWHQVRDLLNRSWNRTTLSMPHSSPHQAVHVQFRLYPGGRAQMMQIAEGSGASEIDQAGIQAIADAQPFPPFPLGVGSKPIEIHVRLQTGSQSGVRNFRTGTAQEPGRTISAPKQ